jgi:hypothetical protein
MIRTAIAVAVLSLSFAAPAHASHPHQLICTATATFPHGDMIQLLIQIESAREYVSGDPNQDVHDFRYQARVCDDDNDTPSCSTYQSKAITHGAADEVTLVGMRDPAAVLFRGKLTADGRMTGKISHDHALVPFTAKLAGCIGQSWVPLPPEAGRNSD